MATPLAVVMLQTHATGTNADYLHRTEGSHKLNSDPPECQFPFSTLSPLAVVLREGLEKIPDT